MNTTSSLPATWFDAIRQRIQEEDDDVIETVQSDRLPPKSVSSILDQLSRIPVGVRGLRQQDILTALKRFDEIVCSRKYARKPNETLPKATDMRPYRFCVQDVVMAIWAMSHRKDEGDVLVDVFLTSEVYDAETGEKGFYDELSGAIAATLTILSEAYRVGVPLRVQFSQSVEGGQVPFDIVRLAARYGIPLKEAREGRILPDEGRSLYLALTGFRPVLRQAIDVLYKQGLMSPERAAYIVHHGVWSLPEVEGIVLCSSYPDMVLSGDVMPEHRHLYQHVLVHSRLALMGGFLDRALMARQDRDADHAPGSKKKGLDVEDDERNLEIRTNARMHGREYALIPGSVPDTLPLPNWGNTAMRLQPGERLSVLLRPRVAASLEFMLLNDLDQAQTRLQMVPYPKVVAVCVAFDFHDLSLEMQNTFRQEADKRNVVLMVCPESTRSMDQLAEKKMIASRIKKD